MIANVASVIAGSILGFLLMLVFVTSSTPQWVGGIAPIAGCIAGGAVRMTWIVWRYR